MVGLGQLNFCVNGKNTTIAVGGFSSLYAACLLSDSQVCLSRGLDDYADVIAGSMGLALIEQLVSQKKSSVQALIRPTVLTSRSRYNQVDYATYLRAHVHATASRLCKRYGSYVAPHTMPKG